MKLLCVVCVLCAGAGAGAVALPRCDRSAGDACAGATPRDTPHGWLTNYYVVNGKRLSVSSRGAELRWVCARGLSPAAPPAPRFTHLYEAISVELIDCETDPSYSDLLSNLNVDTGNLTLAFSTAARYRDERWPSTDELKLFKKNRLNADTDPPVSPRNPLKHLSLRGIPMTVDQLASIRHIESLRLENTGLEEVMDLSEFDKLKRLEVLEGGLRDARRLASAPALAAVVLRAPDAALAVLPRLRSATFIDVYAMESIFGDCGCLQDLTMEGGELAVLRGRWLAGCTRLLRLRVTRLRRLRALPRGLLADAAALETLDLSHNALEALPDDLLAGAAHLTWLDLSGNALHSLPTHLFRTATSLVLVSLRNNPKLTNPEVPKHLEACDSCYYSQKNQTAIFFCVNTIYI